MRCAALGLLFAVILGEGCGNEPALPPATARPSQTEIAAPPPPPPPAPPPPPVAASPEVKRKQIEITAELKERSHSCFRKGLSYFIWLEEDGIPIKFPSGEALPRIRVNYLANPASKPPDFASAFWLVAARDGAVAADVHFEFEFGSTEALDVVSAPEPESSRLLPYVKQWNRQPAHVWYHFFARRAGAAQGTLDDTFKCKATGTVEGNLRVLFFAQAEAKAAYLDPASAVSISNELTVPFVME